MRPSVAAFCGAALALALVPNADAGAPRLFAWVNASAMKQREADRTLRETLSAAADGAVRRLSKPGAFGATPARRIAAPSELQALRGNWNAVGRSGAVDRLQSAMNRAAELAAPHARPLLMDAIAQIDFSDAVAVYRSGDEAATQFLALRARADIEAQLHGAVEDALAQTGAFAELASAAASLNAGGRVGDVRKAMIEATVKRETDALFAEMRVEERRLRADVPAAMARGG